MAESSRYHPSRGYLAAHVTDAQNHSAHTLWKCGFWLGDLTGALQRASMQGTTESDIWKHYDTVSGIQPSVLQALINQFDAELFGPVNESTGLSTQSMPSKRHNGYSSLSGQEPYLVDAVQATRNTGPTDALNVTSAASAAHDLEMDWSAGPMGLNSANNTTVVQPSMETSPPTDSSPSTVAATAIRPLKQRRVPKQWVWCPVSNCSKGEKQWAQREKFKTHYKDDHVLPSVRRHNTVFSCASCGEELSIRTHQEIDDCAQHVWEEHSVRRE